MMDVGAPAVALRLDQLELIRRKVAAHLEQGLKIEDFGIVGSRPDDTENFAFVAITPKRTNTQYYYRCSFCETNFKFSVGKVVLCSDGRLRLIGDDCWRRYLDAERYEKEKKDLQDFSLRRRFEEVSDRLSRGVSAAIPRTRTLTTASHSILGYLERLPSLIEADGNGFGALLRSCRANGGILTVDVTVPDEIVGRDENGKYKKYRLERMTVHQVVGVEAAFGPKPQLSRVAKEALDLLFEVAELIRSVQKDDENAHAAKIIRSIQKKIDCANEYIRIVNDCVSIGQRFLSAANLRGIASWSANPDCDDDLAGKIEFAAGKLTIEMRTGTLLVSPPDGLDAFSTPDLSDLASLLHLR